MKKNLLTLVFSFGLMTLGFAQVFDEPTVFDYEATKYDLSLNVAPVLVGDYPLDLLFRKHYISKNGKNVAFRLGATLGANAGSSDLNNSNGSTVRNNGQSFQAYLGKEWQKTFHQKILGYYGGDVYAGYGRSFNDFTPNDPNQTSTSTSQNFANIGAVGFLGMRYHLSRHFSISAETSANLNFTHSASTTKSTTQNNVNETDISSNGFGFSLSPLRAIRFSFHF